MQNWPYTGKLIIFTTFYEYRGYAPYIKSLATTIGVLERMGIKYDYWQRAGDFHVERAINDTLTKFMNSDATDLLMIDSDEEWDADSVVRLITHPEEIVGATYRMKHKWDTYVGTIKTENGVPVGKMLPDGTALIEALRVAAGFIRFKKSAVKKFHDAYPLARCQEPDGEMTIFYERALIDGIMHSQDMAFSRKWLDIGGQLWVDPTIKVNHYGLTCYPGDFHQYLIGRKKEAEAFAVVEQMAADLKRKAA